MPHGKKRKDPDRGPSCFVRHNDLLLKDLRHYGNLGTGRPTVKRITSTPLMLAIDCLARQTAETPSYGRKAPGGFSTRGT
jgi:hypothetical protein